MSEPEAPTPASRSHFSRSSAPLPGSSDTVITAALLHDVGQFLPYSVLTTSNDDTPYGRPSHATLGASYLASLKFPQPLTFLVASHVTAKRYLAATDPAYVPGSRDCKLSEASVKSLEMQGGPMSEEEVKAWERQEGWEEAIMLRRWDDEAKVVGKEVPGLEAYRDGMARVLAVE
jgi:2-amino-1-hydroxyethylphosphonate dioxygenase (glycine-forming)